MEKKYKELYIIELVMIILYFLSKLLIIEYCFFLSQYFDLFFYFFCFLIFYIKYGIQRNKNYLTRISIRYIVILLLAYIIVIYLIGCFTGFTKSIYDDSLFGILKNIAPITLAVVFQEFLRYGVASNSVVDKKPIILLTILYICIDIFNAAFGFGFNGFYQIFSFICLAILPAIAKETLLSYITYHISLVPTLIYNLAFSVVPYILPIYPDLGDYLNAALGILFPFLVYLNMKKIVEYDEKANINSRKYFIKLMCIPLIIFLTAIVILISGIFNYKLIAIGSDSMNPTYYRGDAVIYEKIQPEAIKEGDILVFEYNHAVITHRVNKIIEEGNEIYFQTKGDNNAEADANLVGTDEVLGKVKYIVKYIGYPTIWLNEEF